MSSDAQDIAVARYLKQEGMVTPEHLQQGLQAQARAVEGGKPISLAQALLNVGAITPAQKETLEKRLKGEEKKGGTQQLGPYRLRKKLGEGGMGAVYLADDSRDGKKVALKVLPRRHAADPEFLKRFRREAEAAIKLDHANIVRAFEAGEEASFHFYAMEYCEGEPLDRALKRTGLFSWHRAFEIVRDVARGLQYAHAQGFIHRDIKPANIFMTAAGMPKILDLGLTKKIDESQLSFQTLSGAVLGTPHYISPEGAKSDKSIDGRSDIYSLGATLYHLLTGEPPFSGNTLYEILSKHVNAELPNPQDVAEDIPDGVVHVLRKMMAKSPNDRYSDCGELVNDVELVLQGKTPQSAALGAGASAVAQLRKQIVGARRKRAGTYRVPLAGKPGNQAALVWGGVGFAALVVIILAVALSSGSSPPTRPADTPPISKSEALPPTLPKPDPGEAAQKKLNDLLRSLNGPPPAEKVKRIAELERFVAEHKGTFAASTAQGIMNDLKKPPVQPGAKPVDDAWIAEVQKLPAEEQVKRVVSKLKELNPGYDGREKHFLNAKGQVIRFDLRQSSLHDIRPIAAMAALDAIELGGTQVEDLTPLAGLPLTGINLSAAVTSLSPLQGMKLSWLSGNMSKIDNLQPLSGMPLKRLSIKGTRATDLSPLQGLRLETLECDFVPERDTAILKSISTLEKINDIPVAEFWKQHEPALPTVTNLKGHTGRLYEWFDLAVGERVYSDRDYKYQSIPARLSGARAIRTPNLDKGATMDPLFSFEVDQDITVVVGHDPRISLKPAWLGAFSETGETLRFYNLTFSIYEKVFPKGTITLGRNALSALADSGMYVVILLPTTQHSPSRLPPTLALDLGGGVVMEMVYIKPGAFTMGGTEGPKDNSYVDERPGHRVTITQGFYLGKYEATRGQFGTFVKETGYVTTSERDGKSHGRRADGRHDWIEGASWRDPVVFKQTADHPVICVNWNDAKAFCDWAAKKTGRELRLPTEAEWEYACRAGTATAWSFGNDKSMLNEYAWSGDNAQLQTHPVGQKKPNPWGLYDMHGNVWEWCEDLAGPYTGDAKDPTGAAGGVIRINRGGSWSGVALDTRSAVRRSHARQHNETKGGFRVALTVGNSSPPAPSRPAHVPADAKEFGGHYYKLFEEKMTWHEAKTQCDGVGGHLVTISNQQENDYVALLTPRKDAWIGLTDEEREGTWVWVTGEPLTFTFWRAGNPDNLGGAEHWADVMWGHGWKWNDSGKSAKMPFICEWEPYPQVDLLKLIDPKRDAVVGTWTIVGEALSSPVGNEGARVQIPYAPPEEYDLTLVVTRKSVVDGATVGLVAGGRQFAIVLDGWDPATSAIDFLDGKGGGTNETTSKVGRIFTDDKPKTIHCAVRRDRLTVTADGKIFIDWKASYSRVSLSNLWTVPDKRTLFVGFYKTPLLFSKILLTPVSGEGQGLR